LHRDTDSLEEQGSKNIVKTQKTKRKVLHLGRNNPRAQYRLGTVWLGSSLAERVLGVLADNKLTISQQCNAAVTKADWTPGCICRTITSRDRDMIVPLCSVLVRPHLEHCIHFQSPQVKKRHGQTGKGPKEGHEDDQRAGEPALWGD